MDYPYLKKISLNTNSNHEKMQASDLVTLVFLKANRTVRYLHFLVISCNPKRDLNLSNISAKHLCNPL